MLPYDICVALRNAGFKQPEPHANFRGLFLNSDNEIDSRFEETAVYSPTLEELIEACGEKFDGLYRGGELGWWATDGEGTKTDGDTATSAVANLWLALNT